MAAADDVDTLILTTRSFKILVEGIVWKAREKETNNEVAIKKIFGAFQYITDAQILFREIIFLQELGDHGNIIKLLQVMKANKYIYLIFEYMETDLHAVIRANILEDIHKRYIIYQLLKATKYMHTGHVIHRDIKPSNLLINSECLLKVADFGLARSIGDPKEYEQVPTTTHYVATRWYRAPEILLGSTTYTTGVDMWSIGCVVGELLGGKPMFPGTSTMNQLERIIEVTGHPSKEDIDTIQSEYAPQILENLPEHNKRGLESMYPNADVDAMDLLKKLLMFSPTRRISSEESLEHPHVAQFHDPEEEICCYKKIEIPINDKKNLSVMEYCEELFSSVITVEKTKKAVRSKKSKTANVKKPARSSSKKSLTGSGMSDTTGSSGMTKKEKTVSGVEGTEKKGYYDYYLK